MLKTSYSFKKYSLLKNKKPHALKKNINNIMQIFISEEKKIYLNIPVIAKLNFQQPLIQSSVSNDPSKSF